MLAGVGATLEGRLLLKAVVLAAAMALPPQGAAAQGYDYPFIDGLTATVIGTPSFYQAELPETVPKQQLRLKIFPERRTRELFWYNDKLRISIVRQREKAPLIFNIAGTGASHNSGSMQIMERAFYKAGYHVISLPSPTHPNFIVSASETQVPGLLPDDSRDLYRVMQAAYAEVARSIEVSEFYLTGYSLGAAQAAFVAKLDEEVGAFGFKKVLMINPPVSLYNSVEILDGMIEAIPGGIENFPAFFQKLFRRFAEVYRDEDFIDFTGDFLFELYKEEPPKEENLQAIIGTAFRTSSANIIFTADVLTRSGVIVRRDRWLTSLSSVTDYFKVSVRVGFTGYIKHLVHPFVQKRRPGVTLDQLIKENSLKAIDGYIRSSRKIGMVTNEDDIILAPGELDYLRELFGDRAIIYNKGGHLGNLAHKDNIENMLGFFAGSWEGS